MVAVVCLAVVAVVFIQIQSGEERVSSPDWILITSKQYFPQGKALVPQLRKIDGINTEVLGEKQVTL